VTLLANDPAPAGTYAAGRVIHDADAHVMEPVGFFEAYADPDIRERLVPLAGGLALGPLDEVRAAHEARRDADAQELLLHKNYDALGAWDGNDRVTVLDRLGFNSQLIFTRSNGPSRSGARRWTPAPTR
jgi:hypothetical protein